MPRNGSGTYALPEAPFVPNTTISSSAVNSDLSDMAAALTGSLARDGQGGMAAALPLSNDGAIFASDPDTGFVRAGANNPAIKAGGNNIVSVTTTGASVAGVLDATSIKQNGILLMPPGLMAPFAGGSAPAGWLLCFGQTISRTTYAALFAAIGTSYGTGDGTTTFNLPDLRGRVPAGKDDMGGSAASRLTNATMTPDGVTLGAVGGEQTHTLTTPEIPAHNHTATDSGHFHNIGNVLRNVGSSNNQFVPGPSNVIIDTPNTSTGFANISVQNTGGGGAHNNVQPSIVTTYIIYAGV